MSADPSNERVGAKNDPMRMNVHGRRSGKRNEPPRPAGDVAKLALILGMLGSDHDGEVPSAARKAEKLRHAMNRTWLQILGVTHG